MKHQGANAPQTGPSERREHRAIRETKADAEAAARVEASGPGPRALSQGGDPGGTTLGGGAAGAGAGGGKRKSMTGHLPGEPGGGGLQKTSQGEGTGQEWVRSSGIKAEGGDFDATAPGAGKEANREYFAFLSSCRRQDMGC